MKRLMIPKINSIHFGGKWLMIAFMIGGIAPLLLWLVFHIFLWQLCVVGGIILVGLISFTSLTQLLIVDFRMPYSLRISDTLILIDRLLFYSLSIFFYSKYK